MQLARIRACVLSVLSALLQIVIFPIAGPVSPWRTALSWVALLPLLLALLASGRTEYPYNWKHGFVLGYLCGSVWYLGNCYWIYQTMYLYGGLPKTVSLAILVLFSLYLGLYHAFFAALFLYLRHRIGVAGALTLAPFLWVAGELARARITGFPWDLLGYSQVDNFLLTRLTPLAGVMALSFVVAAGNSLFTAAWITTGRRRVILVAAGLLFALTLQAAGTHQPPADSAPHLATLMQENLAVGATGHMTETLTVGEKYRQFSAASLAPAAPSAESSFASARTDFIVWPESTRRLLNLRPALPQPACKPGANFASYGHRR